MKFVYFIILLIVISSALATRSRKALEGKKRVRRNKAIVSNSSNASVARENLTLNSIGRVTYVNESDIFLTKAPYKISRCDQVIKFTTNFIPDMDEYRVRTSGYIVMGAWYTMLYKDNNATQLLKSILMSKIPTEPQFLVGTGDCIVIQSDSNRSDDITICIPEKSGRVNMLEVLKTFAQCRGGVDLNSVDENLVYARLIAGMSANGKFQDPRLMLEKCKKKKMQGLKQNRATGFFHPGDNRIPGTPPPKPKVVPKMGDIVKPGDENSAA